MPRRRSSSICSALYSYRELYLNRYLILAVIFFVPVLAVVLHGLEKGRLRSLLLLAVCAAAGAFFRHDAPRQRNPPSLTHRSAGADMMEAADYLTENGYTHGYGTFWKSA